jgi:hypothetical protein
MRLNISKTEHKKYKEPFVAFIHLREHYRSSISNSLKQKKKHFSIELTRKKNKIIAKKIGS